MVMVEEVQPGWHVFDSKGDEIGVVVSAVGPSLKVKAAGREMDIPNSAVSFVETGRVELNVTRQELTASA